MRKSFWLVFLVAQCLTASQSQAGLIFTAVAGTQVGENIPLNLFARSTAGESLFSLDINTIKLSAGTFVQTSPTSSIPNNPSFGSLFTGTVASANVNLGSYLAFDPVVDRTLGYLSISYNAAQPIPSSDGLIASWNINTAGISGGTVGLTLAGFIPTDSTFANPTVSFNGGDAAGNYTFAVTAVPEPTSMALLAVVGIVGIAYRRFRKNAIA